jgi:hypothetical protein
VYPQNKFHLQVLQLKRWSHDGAHACRICCPLGRYGRDLQRIEPHLPIVLCVFNIQENWEARHMWNALCNPLLECKKHETGWHPSSTLWGVWRTCHEWFSGIEMVRHFNVWCENVHDDPRRGWLSLVNEDSVRAVEEKIQENRRFTISSLSLHFLQISRPLHKIVSYKLRFQKLCSRWVPKLLMEEHKMKWQSIALTFLTWCCDATDNACPHTAASALGLIATFF